MDPRKQCSSLAFLLVLFLVTFSCGCLGDDGPYLHEDALLNDNIANTVSDDIGNDDAPEKGAADLDRTSPGIDTYTETVSLKRTGILELENGYSLKVLDIDNKEKQIWISFRKDGNEYATATMLAGHTYKVKDTKGLKVIYDLRVDKILENNFVVQITCTIRPQIWLETGIYQGKIRENEVRVDENTIFRTYRWIYDNTEFTIAYEYSIKAYDAYSERSRYRDFSHFVNDPYDDELISQVTKQIEELAIKAGYSRDEIPYIAMTFVQSLPYVSDSASSGYDEYPRFPFETLYHGGGDCEDSSILLGALLYDMDYGVALIELPGHMAIGVKGDAGLPGSYYEHSGNRYYYLETTDSGWSVGVVPDEYINAEAIVVPISKGYPQLRIGFNGNAKNSRYATCVDMDIEVMNVGSELTEDIVIYATLETTTEMMVWDELKIDTRTDLPVDRSLAYSVSDLCVPAGEGYRVAIWSWGSNADAEYVYSDWLTA